MFGSIAAFAAEAGNDNRVLTEGMGVTVTGADVVADAQRIPLPARNELLAKPENASQVASNLYVRRALAAEAAKAGLDQDPLVRRQLEIARDRVLSDARLALIDKANLPDAAAAARYANDAYKADPSRFQAPEEIRARHILVKGTTAEARVKAQQLLDELNGGADFGSLAKKSSDDPGSAADGGDLGFFGKGRMVPAFEEAAFALKKPGELSPLIESPFGFHIIQLVERRAPGVRPFSEVEGELKDEAASKIVSAARQTEVQRLLEAAKFDKPAIEAFAKSHDKQ